MMKKHFKSLIKGLAIISVLVMISCNQQPDNPDHLNPQSKMDSISYIIGYDYGEGIANQEIQADPQMIYKGIYDALEKKQSIFSDSVEELLVADFNREVETLEADRYQRMLEKNLQEGREFLEANKEREGVEVLPSGLQYKIIKIGEGGFPSPTDSVTIHYRAMYIDRTTFDMSYDSGPVSIRLNHVLKGLSEGIQLMRKGAIYEFYIPPGLAYGNENYMDLIPSGSTIIYSVELIDIHGE
ncbi:MAG: FKBP-type peptidyl-prolyl cis-trans isomerase N-terminal domain-containing protein [Bacteroidales bacterium]